MAFFAELKRRHVFRVAALYAAVAWLPIQAARRALELDPGSSEAHVALGRVAEQSWLVTGQDRRSEAGEHFRRALELDRTLARDGGLRLHGSPSLPRSSETAGTPKRCAWPSRSRRT